MSVTERVGGVGMKKDYIVELKEEEADELMDEHWVGELVRCKECKWRDKRICYNKTTLFGSYVNDDWFCADGRRREE